MATNLNPSHPLIHEYFISENNALNKKLQEHVEQEIKRTTGLNVEEKHSNIGGWHSEKDLALKIGNGTIEGNLLLLLFSSFSPCIMEYIKGNHEKFMVQKKESYDWNYAGSWFNVAFDGSYNAPHVHPGSQISGAYYIKTEEPTKEKPFSGRIDFIDRRVQHGFFPKPGTLFLFPSDMLHFVHPYYGSNLRICLSFNLTNIV